MNLHAVKNKLVPGILTVCFWIYCGFVEAGVISVNLIPSGSLALSVGTVNTNVFTGVVGDPIWEDSVLGTVPGVSAFTNVDGTTMNVSVYAPSTASSSATAWNHWANRNGASATSSEGISVSLSNIPYAHYYIVVYVGGYNTAYQAAVSDGTTTKYVNFMALTTIPALVESTDTDGSDGSDAGSYILLGSPSDPLSGASRTLTLTRIAGNVTMGGFQVVEADSRSLRLLVIQN